MDCPLVVDFSNLLSDANTYLFIGIIKEVVKQELELTVILGKIRKICQVANAYTLKGNTILSKIDINRPILGQLIGVTKKPSHPNGPGPLL